MGEEMSGAHVPDASQKPAVVDERAKPAIEERATTVKLWDRIPQWFIPSVALIYATGFLINISFLDRFGLRESSGEFFKVKYLHDGILFWLLPTIVLAPIYGFYLVWQFGKDEVNKGQPFFKVYVPSALLVTNLLFVFYVFAVFTPPGSIIQREFVLPAMFLFTIVGIIATRVGAGKLISKGLAPEVGDSLTLYGRWLLCVGIVVIFGLVCASRKFIFSVGDFLAWRQILFPVSANGGFPYRARSTT